MDVYSLLSIVTSYYRPDNYDLHIKLCIASKKYYEFIINLNIDKYFNAVVRKHGCEIIHEVCSVRHRLHGPAIIGYRRGKMDYKIYCINGKVHREDILIGTEICSRPACIKYHENGEIRGEIYYINSKRHRIGMPAYIGYHNNGIKSTEEYRFNDETHREDGPAVIEYRYDGSIIHKQYVINGRLHRVNDPAWIEYSRTGKVERERYAIHGKLHREGGPAWIEYESDGSIKCEKYYIDGRRIRASVFREN